jgi:replicative DNA helicase
VFEPGTVTGAGISDHVDALEDVTLRRWAGELADDVISTGIPSVDHLASGGMRRKELWVLAARPSMGKTALMLHMARRCRSLIFSLEMSSQQLTDRMLAAQSGVDSWRLRTGKIRGDDEFERLQHGMAALSEAPIYIDDKPGSTVLAMRSVARRLKMEKGLGLVVIDYLQLITPGSARANDSTVQQVTEISRALKGMARELDVPVLALSQLSRAVESRGGRPRLSDLRDSGSLEQDADVVMFIHREDMSGTRTDTQERTNIAEVLIEKHRNGPLGRVELKFDDQKTTFVSLDKTDFGDFTPEAHVDTDTTPF